jgi:hypothetical protein
MGLGEIPVLSFERVATVGSSQRTDAIDMGGSTPVGLVVSTNNLGATSITFEVARGSTHTFYTLATSSGGTYTINTSTQAALQYILDHTKFLGVQVAKIVLSSTAGADTNKTFTWVTRPVAY